MSDFLQRRVYESECAKYARHVPIEREELDRATIPTLALVTALQHCDRKPGSPGIIHPIQAPRFAPGLYIAPPGSGKSTLCYASLKTRGAQPLIDGDVVVKASFATNAFPQPPGDRLARLRFWRSIAAVIHGFLDANDDVVVMMSHSPTLIERPGVTVFLPRLDAVISRVGAPDRSAKFKPIDVLRDFDGIRARCARVGIRPREGRRVDALFCIPTEVVE